MPKKWEGRRSRRVGQQNRCCGADDDAGKLALQWLGSQIAIPMHYNPDDDSMNQEVNQFIDYCNLLAPTANVVKMNPGEIFEFNIQK